MDRARRNAVLAPLLAAVLLMSAAGCLTARPHYALGPEQLRQELIDRLGPEEAARVSVPFEVTPELRKFAKHVTAISWDDRQRVQDLALALSDPEGLSLRYDKNITGNAEKVLAKGGGDCLSLTALFIGMARSIELEVYFIDARGVQEFSREGSMLVDRRHVVAGWGKPPVFTMVDFNHVGTGNVQYRMLSDLQALARFFNNYGFDDLKNERLDEAAAHYRAAIKLDPTFAAAHNNLGIVLSRNGDQDGAERELRQALALDGTYSAAILNLSSVLTRVGRVIEAEELRAASLTLRLRDPVWRLQLGLDELQAQHFEKAITELRAAIALDPSVMDAWFALGQAYAARGERDRALKAIERVLQLIPTHEAARMLRDRLLAEKAHS